MNKRKIFENFNDFTTKVNMGNYLLGIIKQYVVNPSVFIQEVASYQIMVMAFGAKIPSIYIVLLLLFKNWIMIFIHFIGGIVAKKTGFWKAQSEFQNKKEHISPFNSQLMETVKEICKKLEIKDKFSDYYDEKN